MLCALLMQSAVAQPIVTTTYGLNVGLGVETREIELDPGIEVKWLKTVMQEFYPSTKEYEADVKTLLNSPPICLETDTYCRTAKSSERGIDLGGIVWKKTETLPSTTRRPHEDPRVVENWDRQRRIQQGQLVIKELITGESFAEQLRRWSNPSEPMVVGGDQ